MKANTSLFTIALLVGGLGAGCASSSDVVPRTNTGRGAAVGAATGAVLGGIIGNNTSGDTTKGAVIGAAAGGLAGAAIGNQADRRHENAVAGVSSQDVAGGYVVQSPPPSPTSQPYEPIPARPSSNAVWIPGYYNYTGTSYEWISGRWEIPPSPTSVWAQPSWQPQGNGYVYVRGHWQ